MYRLKVNYKGHWKYAQVTHETLESAIASQKKLTSMGVKSKLCDFTGKEVEE